MLFVLTWAKLLFLVYFQLGAFFCYPMTDFDRTRWSLDICCRGSFQSQARVQAILSYEIQSVPHQIAMKQL